MASVDDIGLEIRWALNSKKHATRPMNLIDLFCGCGGFALGAKGAGFEIKAAYDVDPILTYSHAVNFPQSKLVLTDVAKLDAGAIKRQMDGGRIDGVFGGPPCQGFSNIGRRDVNDPRRKLLLDFFRLVKEVRPRFFVMENVLGLQQKDARSTLERAIAILPSRYQILGPIVLDASDFGAATKRPRLFVIGVDEEYCDPISTIDIDVLKRPAATVYDAISDVQNPDSIGVVDGYDFWRITKIGRPSGYAALLRSEGGVFSGHRRTVHSAAVIKRFKSVAQGSTDVVGRHPRLSWLGQCPTLRAGTGNDKGSY